MDLNILMKAAIYWVHGIHWYCIARCFDKISFLNIRDQGTVFNVYPLCIPTIDSVLVGECDTNDANDHARRLSMGLSS